jgi:hypothetical protein
MKLSLILITLLILTAPLFAAENEPNVPAKTLDVQTIVDKANLTAYYQGADGKAKVSMVITDRQGQVRNREFIIIRKDIQDGGDQNYFVYFLRPADVRRMVFMVHKHTQPGVDDDRWLYLPSLDLVRRIAASDKRTSFVGSDFLYEDVSGRSLLEDTHELTKTTEKFYVVKNVPKSPDIVEFSYYNVSIDKQNSMPVKMEYYDKQNKLYRTIEALKIETIQNYPTVTKSLVSDLNTGSKTEMEFSDAKYDVGVGDIFKERYLRRPPQEVLR